MADKLRKYKSLYTSTSNSFSTGTSVSITLNSSTGLPTDTDIVLTFDRVDGSGTATPTKMERILGTVSGNTFSVITRGYDGSTEQAHTTPVVEQIWNASDWNDMLSALLVEHEQDGTHDASITKDDDTDISGNSWVLDEDDMSSDDNTKVPSQQSVKAYADTKRKKTPVIYDNGNSGTAKTIDWTNGEKQKITLTDNCTLTFSNVSAGMYLTLYVIQDSTGSRTLTFPSGTKTSEGDGVTISTGADKRDIIGITAYDSSTYDVVATVLDMS